MKITYLKNLEANQTINTITVKGISEAEIADYEKKLNINSLRHIKNLK